MWNAVLFALRFVGSQLERGPTPSWLGVLTQLWRDVRDPDAERLARENAFLRYQLAVLRRQVGRCEPSATERAVLTLASKLVGDWRERASLFVVQPDTLIRWHRIAFKAFWAKISRLAEAEAPSPPPRVKQRWLREDERELVLDVAGRNPGWGVRRIRNHVFRVLRICVHKRTVQRILDDAPTTPPSGQSWGTFVRNHLDGAWACDFLSVPVGFLQFRLLYVFFVIRLRDRRILHWAVSFHPTQAWVVQQLREVTSWCEGPGHFLRDADGKFGAVTDAVLEACGAKVHVVPATGNVYAERFVGTLRRELLDHLVVLGEDHLRARLRDYMTYYNELRPHQGLEGEIPAWEEDGRSSFRSPSGDRITVVPILGGLVHYHVRERDRHRLRSLAA